MHFIIALGNPGKQYQKTRHNLGWQVADALVASGGLMLPRHVDRVHGALAEGIFAGQRVSILYPDTFMNKSGEAVVAFVPSDKRSEMLVVHDEVALPLGALRISVDSSAGGHNGVQSIIDRCGTSNFIRVRLGIGSAPAGVSLERFVLGKFIPEEELLIQTSIKDAVAAVTMIVSQSAKDAMQEFNAIKKPTP